MQELNSSNNQVAPCSYCGGDIELKQENEISIPNDDNLEERTSQTSLSDVLKIEASMHHIDSLSYTRLLNIAGQVKDLESQLEALQTICAESYQVVGFLANETEELLDTPEVQKALDNLCQAKLVHTDVIPFYPSKTGTSLQAKCVPELKYVLSQQEKDWWWQRCKHLSREEANMVKEVIRSMITERTCPHEQPEALQAKGEMMERLCEVFSKIPIERHERALATVVEMEALHKLFGEKYYGSVALQAKGEMSNDKMIKHMTDRFLCWKLPADFDPDCGISFDPICSKGTKWEGLMNPIGTNLFTTDQTKAMFEYCLLGFDEQSEVLQAKGEDCERRKPIEGRPSEELLAETADMLAEAAQVTAQPPSPPLTLDGTIYNSNVEALVSPATQKPQNDSMLVPLILGTALGLILGFTFSSGQHLSENHADLAYAKETRARFAECERSLPRGVYCVIREPEPNGEVMK